MDFKLDSDGDLQFKNNAISMTEEGLDSIAQRLRIRLRFFFREWVLDRSKGTKWFELVLKKNVDKHIADQEIRRIVLETPQIKSIDYWDSNIDSSNRQYNVNFSVSTTLGQKINLNFSDIFNS